MTQKAYSSGSTCPPLSKDTLRLYSSRLCPYAQRARLVLQHKHIPHEIVNINLSDKPDWFLTLAPVGKVPVLHLRHHSDGDDDDVILYESTAVCEYLDDAHGGPADRLQRHQPYQKASDRILLEQYGQVTSAFYAILFGAGKEEKTEEVMAKVDQLHKAFEFYDRELAKRGTRFFGGPSTPAMVDYYLWPHLERIPTLSMMVPRVSLGKAQFPRLAEWWDDMTQVPAVREEMHDPQWHREVYKLFTQGKHGGDHGLEE